MNRISHKNKSKLLRPSSDLVTYSVSGIHIHFKKTIQNQKVFLTSKSLLSFTCNCGESIYLTNKMRLDYVKNKFPKTTQKLSSQNVFNGILVSAFFLLFSQMFIFIHNQPLILYLYTAIQLLSQLLKPVQILLHNNYEIYLIALQNFNPLTFQKFWFQNA